jgi:hypothetical protein
MPEKKASKADRPPADAPIPTMGQAAEALAMAEGGWALEGSAVLVGLGAALALALTVCERAGTLPLVLFAMTALSRSVWVAAVALQIRVAVYTLENKGRPGPAID